MNSQSFTTSSAVAQTDNSAVSGGGTTPDSQDFLLLCKDGNIAEAVHALYYLPQNYKLMVVANAARSSENEASWMENISLKGRIRFEDMTVKQLESPYLFADAIISDDTDAETVKSADAPYVVVSATAGNGLTMSGANGFTVQTGNPEALASAILHIARKN